ncbi:hypothetical protein FLACOL7796_03170 [Flavobacterium collinsii]|uniref:Uncharacterized protein n=1 Tax=Flavobacterium collinsii TaxID=1114861 RepID=A0ABM8KL71_9FLAO|nr:hypothetical protein FLACOL7796_03170 [Flavobacterium collinsii]
MLHKCFQKSIHSLILNNIEVKHEFHEFTQISVNSWNFFYVSVHQLSYNQYFNDWKLKFLTYRNIDFNSQKRIQKK